MPNRPCYCTGYNFVRLSKEGEKNWNDVINRFIGEMIKRGCKTPKKDLDWLCLNYYALPNSPALQTAGDKKFYASACSSYPITDSMDEGEFSILNTLKISSMATKAGIGTGFNFSNLRSKEEMVSGKKNRTGGPVSFLRAYNGFMKEITQCTRKSAAMGTLSVHHPDIVDFITCKQKDGTIENFNLSVLLSDEFMEAVEKNEDYEVKYPSTGKIKKIKAKEVFDLIAMNTWNNGEPGLLFTGNIKKDYFTEIDDNHILNNPCSEALLSYSEEENPWLEMCVLASINLPKFAELNLRDKQRVVSIIVSMLNDIIDLQDYVSPLQERGMKYINRKIGIGVAGLSTLLAKKNMKYTSEEAFEYTKEYFTYIGDFAKIKSEEMYKEAINVTWASANSPLNVLKRFNASLLSVAPTSSISNIFNDMNEEGCSYGIEPYFSLDPITIHNSFGTFETKEKIIDFMGTEEKARAIIDCANDIDYKAHLNPIEAYYESNWGQGITQACSKTINFKNNVTVEEVKDAIMYCWKHKIKGISFYRNGSRKNQVIQTKDSYKDCIELDAKGRPVDLFVHQSPKRPEYLSADIFRVTKDKQDWLILVGLFKDKPYEIFAGLEEAVSIPKKYKTGKIQKNGGYNLILGEGEDEMKIKDIPNAFKNPQFASLTRLISFSLRHGGPVKFLTEQLLKEGGFDAFNKAIARVLKKYINDNEDSAKKCPECGGEMKYIAGCPTCKCGYTKCG